MRTLKYLQTAFLMIFIFAFSVLSAQQAEKKIKKEIIPNAEKVIGLEFSDAERDSMQDALNDQLKNYENIRKVKLENSIPPAVLFNPIPTGYRFEKKAETGTVRRLFKY